MNLSEILIDPRRRSIRRFRSESIPLGFGNALEIVSFSRRDSEVERMDGDLRWDEIETSDETSRDCTNGVEKSWREKGRQ